MLTFVTRKNGVQFAFPCMYSGVERGWHVIIIILKALTCWGELVYTKELC